MPTKAAGEGIRPLLEMLKLDFQVVWEVPNIRGTLFGGPIVRTIVFLGLYSQIVHLFVAVCL